VHVLVGLVGLGCADLYAHASKLDDDEMGGLTLGAALYSGATKLCLLW
jgi:hypothetical protein